MSSLRTRPLFIIGNKRSGTSQLVRVLNLHPQIFVSHESDIIWILYQFHHQLPFQAHALDSALGMHQTLETAGNLLRLEKSPLENFGSVQTALMEEGTPWLAAQKKTDLLWIGDKKPMQHTDSELLTFILQQFPEAHFLHIVRHPFEVVASSDKFNQTSNGDFWLNLSPEEKADQWASHEQQVLLLRQILPARIHSLRYEDFCLNTEKELSDVFKFLQLEPDSRIFKQAARQTYPLIRAIPKLRCSKQVMDVAAIYKYDLKYRHGWLRILTYKIYWCLVKYWRLAKL